MTIRTFTAASMAVLALAMAPAVLAQQPAAAPKPPSNAIDDPSLKGTEVIKFIGLKSGDKIVEVVGGKFTPLFAKTVGEKGKVYDYEPDGLIATHAAALTGAKAMAAASPNIEVIQAPTSAPKLPSGLDYIFIRQNYHDLYDVDVMGQVDVPAFNKAMLAALKPGGSLIIIDHADAAGTGIKDTDTTHRIEEQRVKDDMKAAGFKLDGESKILANPDDDHSKMVFNPAIRGKTDQFLVKFTKPK